MCEVDRKGVKNFKNLIDINRLKIIYYLIIFLRKYKGVVRWIYFLEYFDLKSYKFCIWENKRELIIREKEKK